MLTVVPRAQGVASLVLNIWTQRLMETSDKMQSRQIVFLFCHSFANNTKQYIYILFTPTLKLLHSTTPNKGAPWSPVPRQWSQAQYSVSELQPKYVPAAAQSVVELSIGCMSAMIINNGRFG